LLARVLQVCDIYDALTNARSYKPAYSPKAAIRILEEETASGWRDPELVAQFLRIHDDVIAPIGDSSRPSGRGLSTLAKSLMSLDQVVKPLANFVGLPVTL
jgi:HD-GYP domain-containing protein (c-di-GMP phosphodiesterase class II)